MMRVRGRLNNRYDARKDEQSITKTRDKSVSQVSRRSKSDVKFWKERLYKQVSGRGTESPHWSVKIKHRGRRVAFSLHTGNKDAAARRAMNIFNAIVDKGWDEVMAERRKISPEVPSSGRSQLELDRSAPVMSSPDHATTFASYCRALSFIAVEIAAMSKDASALNASSRASIAEGRCDSLSAPDTSSDSEMEDLTTSHGTESIQREQALRGSHATSRSGPRRALFSKRIMKFADLTLIDPLPFSGVEFFPRESMKYHSKIDPAALLQAASAELAESDPGAFLALLLALGAGFDASRSIVYSGGRSTASRMHSCRDHRSQRAEVRRLARSSRDRRDAQLDLAGVPVLGQCLSS